MKLADRNIFQILSFLVFIFLFIIQSKPFAQSNGLDELSFVRDDSTKFELNTGTHNVLLNSVPQDASVFYNETLIGNTPLFVESKFEHLTLKKNGYDNLLISFSEISC